jgi:hypothetical protein
LSDKEINDLLIKYKQSGELSLKDSVKKITTENKLSRSRVYSLALEIWNTS